MWLAIASTSYGVLSAFDPIIFIYIAYVLGASSVYMGILSASWSITYIVFSRVLGSLADAGRNRLLALLALIAVIPIPLLLKNPNQITALLAYNLHALAMASLNLSLSVSILENFDSADWNTVNTVNRVLNNVARGFTLIAMAMLGLGIFQQALQILVVLMALTLAVIPSIYMPLHRKLYMFEKTLDKIGLYIKASTSLLYLDKPKVATEIFEKVWNSTSSVPSPAKIIVGIMGAVIVGDYIFTVIPVIMRKMLGVSVMWSAYGIAAIVSAAIGIGLSRISSSSATRKAFAVAVLRLAVLSLGLGFVRDVITLATYIILSSALFLVLDIMLYNAYVLARAGYGTSTYFIAREIGSIIGSLAGGVIYSLYPDLYIYIAIALGLATALPLAT
jgi:hypothetical protein